MDQFLQMLSAGGDVGIYMVVYILHRFDKRIALVEDKVK